MKFPIVMGNFINTSQEGSKDMREDKQKICDALVMTLRLTRDHTDLTDLIYEMREDGYETVTAAWAHGGKRTINVTLDSGQAMIRDIMRCI